MTRFNGRGDAGFALVAVLGVVSILALITTVVMGHARSGSEATYTGSLLAHERALAEAGMAFAASGLLLEDDKARWMPDGQPNEVVVADITISVSVNMATDYLNINYAGNAQIAETFLAAGVSDDLAQRLANEIVDWRDSDSVTGPMGAEDVEYNAPGKPGLPPNGPFVAIEELRSLPSMTDEAWGLVSPMVTVLGTHRDAPSVSFGTAARQDGEPKITGLLRDGLTRQVGDQQPGIYVVSVSVPRGTEYLAYRGAFRIEQKSGRYEMKVVQHVQLQGDATAAMP